MAKQTPDVYLSTKWLVMEYEGRVKAFKLGREAGQYDRTHEHARKIALDTAFKAEIDSLAERVKGGELDGSPEVTE
ncbi:MAG: hypothetical protein ACREOP_09110 [Thermodesulfobacteriota bacterium]